MVNMSTKTEYAHNVILHVLLVLVNPNALHVLPTTSYKKVLVLLLVKLDSMVIVIRNHVLNVQL